MPPLQYEQPEGDTWSFRRGDYQSPAMRQGGRGTGAERASPFPTKTKGQPIHPAGGRGMPPLQSPAACIDEQHEGGMNAAPTICAAEGKHPQESRRSLFDLRRPSIPLQTKNPPPPPARSEGGGSGSRDGVPGGIPKGGALRPGSGGGAPGGIPKGGALRPGSRVSAPGGIPKGGALRPGPGAEPLASSPSLPPR